MLLKTLRASRRYSRFTEADGSSVAATRTVFEASSKTRQHSPCGAGRQPMRSARLAFEGTLSMRQPMLYSSALVEELSLS